MVLKKRRGKCEITGCVGSSAIPEAVEYAEGILFIEAMRLVQTLRFYDRT